MLYFKRASSLIARRMVLTTIALLVVTVSGPEKVSAGQSASSSTSVSGTSDATDFSAARRHRYVRRGSNAAGLAFMGMAIGTIGAIAAQQQRNDYYNNGYYNNGYGYAPGYYGGSPYYGHRYYR